MSTNRLSNEAVANPDYQADEYQYNVAWSEEDQAFIGRVAEFPSLAVHGETLAEALQEITFVVEEALADLRECGEQIPEPYSKKSFSGRFNVRVSEHLHRQLAIEARRQGVSLNQLVNSKLEAPLPVK